MRFIFQLYLILQILKIPLQKHKMQSELNTPLAWKKKELAVEFKKVMGMIWPRRIHVAPAPWLEDDRHTTISNSDGISEWRVESREMLLFWPRWPRCPLFRFPSLALLSVCKREVLVRPQGQCYAFCGALTPFNSASWCPVMRGGKNIAFAREQWGAAWVSDSHLYSLRFKL